MFKTSIQANDQKILLQRLSKQSTQQSDRLNTVLVFMLLAVSAIDFFYLSQNYILIAFLISTFCFFRYKKRINIAFLRIVLLFAVVETLQFVLLGGFNARTFVGTYIRLFLAFSVVTLVGVDFFKIYVRILYFISVISLVFYAGSFIPGSENIYINVLSNLIPNPFGAEGFYKNNPNVVLVTFNGLFSDHRNSGAFWEPGAFAVFLMLALLFNTLEEKKLWTKKNIVFIICLITTFSTTSYLALFVFIVYLNVDLIIKNALYSVVFIGVLIGSIYIYNETPFLKDKIQNNILLANETTTSRFGSALADIEAFKRSPLVGLGRAGAKENFISVENFGVENHRNNGVFDLLSKYGLPLTLIYFFQIYNVFFQLNKRFQISKFYPVFAFLIILMLGFSQGLFLRPFMYSFLFLPFFIKLKYK